MNSSTLKLTIALVVTFLFGGITGFGLSFGIGHMFFPPPGRTDIANHIQHFLTSRLDLNPEQQDQIRPIVTDFASQLDSLRVQSANHLLEISSTCDDKIRPILNPDQQKKLDDLAKERKDIFGKGGFGPGP